MSISPPSDIILDVARAADPGKMLAATERLVQLAGDRGPDSSAFASLVDGMRKGRGPDRPFDPATAMVNLQNRQALANGGGLRSTLSPMTPHQQFEAFVLRSFVETMLPKDAEAVFGSGTAGDVWKGMLAEKIGDELARSGGIGIAEQLARVHPSSAPAATASAQPQAEAHAALDDLAFEDKDDPFSPEPSAGSFFSTFWRSGG
jgi:peptidoglycan hydrolase FlgJ